MRIMILAMLLPLAACGNGGKNDDVPEIQGSGSGAARSYPVAGFTGIDLRGSDDVDVRVGAGFSVRAEGDPKVLDRLKIERDGDTLKVGRRSGTGFNWSGDDKGAKIYVTLPRLSDAGVSGSGDMTVDRVEGAKFEGSVAGSGTLTLGTLATQAAVLNIAGSGDVVAAGAVQSLDVSIAGSGAVEAAKLTATRADISVAGSGDVRAAVNGAAKIAMMGSGDVDLGPGARCETSQMGSGTVRCGK